MVTASNGHKDGLRLPEVPAADSTRRGAQRANSVTPPAANPAPRHSPSPSLVRRMAAWLNSRDSLLDARRGSIRSTWSGHREAASRWEKTWYVRHARHAWGLVHLVIHTILDVIDWVTETFLRTLVAAVVIFALTKTHWS